MPDDPEVMLTATCVDAAVRALAQRNNHHLASMTDAERGEAVLHWRELALAVLTAATAATQTEAGAGDEAGPGRAVVVLEDVEADRVAVHVSFHPELEELGDGQIAGTPAQIAALELLDTLGARDELE